MQVSYRNVEGFTLLELLVALSIGVVLMAASSVTIKSSVDLMAKKERWLQKDIKETYVLEFLREQVSAIRVGDSTNILFAGKQGELNFVTPVALNSQGKGLIVGRYYVQKESEHKHSLVYREKRLTPAGTTRGKEGKDPEGLVFLTGYDRIGFEYLGEVRGDTNSWMAEWRGGGDIPRALKLTLIRGEEQKTLIAPIVAMFYSSSYGP